MPSHVFATEVTDPVIVLSKLELPEPIEDIEEFTQKNLVGISSVESGYALSNVRSRIAIIDTGVALQHPGLSRMNVVHMRNMINNSNNIFDSHGHGTHVTGILAAQGISSVSGLIPNAEYVIIKALNNQGETDDQILAQSIRHAVQQGAKVILISSGISVHSNSLQSAVDFAHSYNTIIVAAAGNNVNKPQFPAAYSNVIGVGSVDRNGNRSTFSPTGYENDVMASGENIVSLNTTNGTRTLSGTSMAAPVVAALALALIDRNPNASIQEIISHIYLTSSNASSWSPERGWGTISYSRALGNSIGNTSTISNISTMERALPLSRNSMVAGEIRSNTHYQWYQIQNAHSGELNVNARVNRTPLRIDLFDENMRLITTRQIISSSQRVNFSLATSNMYLRVSNNNGGNITKYSLATEFSIAPDIWEVNNGSSQSKRLPLRATIDSTIHRGGDQDWFYVDVIERGYLQVNVLDVPEHMDPVLQVQGNNNRFTIDQNAAGKEERFIRLIDPGRYHIGINDYNQNAVNYPYILDVSFTPLNVSRMTDITNHWARIDINRLLSQGIIRGYAGSTLFQPNRNITRAEFATMLVSATKLAYPETSTRTYRDVATNHWAHYTITIAKEFGMIQGYPDQTFRPDALVTRAEMATMVHKMYEGQLRLGAIKRYADVPTSYWAYTPITNLSRAQVLTGYQDQLFRPNAFVTRAEAATVIARVLN